ncbi:MAG: type IV toxin-antitoxin system AbiEi family antitoxin [Hyphomicrobiales bacterium]|nr:type IV toxin-antitoxin system AbiEi family antitoxin [Hyphomicrobiales bacterium]MCP5372034.1 type IV toxin-antitoxin system AbiEi family antitoxin [Hyphomicrobiales bacterium]
MNTEFSHARDFIDDLAARGRYHFTSAEAKAALGVSADAAKLALNRLRKQGRVAIPARGFYVIVPPEYRSIGCLPADQFIPQLMEKRSLSYYAGLLSAAQYYGAAHHRPQEFQVLVGTARRALICGKVRVTFITRKRIGDVATRPFNTPRGSIAVSTPEATAIDLAGYPDHTGGLEQCATVLSELSGQLDPDRLVDAARTVPLPWAQRLGYLLSIGEAGDVTGPLRDFVRNKARGYVPLALHGDRDGPRSRDWKLILNEAVEPEF